MSHGMRGGLVLAVAFFLAARAVFPAEGGGFLERLFVEMMDPEGLARLEPEGAYHLASSADPKNGGLNLDHYVDLDAGGRAVLADLKGPGCVRRIFFSGAPSAGGVDFLKKPRELLFFFDGEAQPRLKTTLQSLADDIADWKVARPYPHQPVAPLVGAGGGGYYCYLPLPYAQSLKIVMDASDLRGFAYQIGYHAYAKAPEGLRTFTREELSAALRDTELATRVSDVEVTPVTGFRLRERVLEETLLEKGQSLEAELTGPGIVRELEVRWQRSDLATQRGAVLRCWWDSEEQPSVEVPVDDLFGFDHGNKSRVILYPIERQDGNAGARTGRLWLPMPFYQNARIALVNEDAQPLPAALTARYKRLRALDEGLGLLHARWVRSPKSEGRTEPHTVAEVKGAGRLAGVMLSVNKARSGRDYLEAAETLNLDGRTLHGTAMDHFFNGYNNYRRRFEAAFHGVPIQRKGNVTQFRFFIPDSILFEKHFALSFPYMQEDFASIAFWYQREPHAPFPPLQAAAERARFFRTFRLPGALEAEDLKIQATSNDRYHRIQFIEMGDYEGGDWSNETQVYFEIAGPAWFAMKFPVAADGAYDVVVHLTRGEAYTQARVLLDDKPCALKLADGSAAEVFEGRADETAPSGPVSLGVHALSKGVHILKFSHPDLKSRDKEARTVIGFDAVELRKQ